MYKRQFVDLSFWARASDLAEVLTEPARIAFSDGSAVNFLAGVPVLPVPGAWVAQTGFVRVRLDERPAGLGRVFQWKQRHPDLERAVQLDADEVISVAGRSVLMEALPTTNGRVAVARADGERVVFQNDCAIVEAVRKPGGPPDVVPSSASWRGEPPPTETVAVPADTRLVWPDGIEAGRTRLDLEFEGPTRLDDAGRRCVAVDASLPRRLWLCVDPTGG